MPRCVHCLRQLSEETRDHVFPSSWYPDDTPDHVQRWTVPSCPACNGKFGKIEQDLLVRLGLCVDPAKAEATGISAKALRSVGVGVDAATSEKERIHRAKLKERILALMKPYGEVKGKPGILPGFGPNKWFPEELQEAILVPDKLLREVAQKIIRGLEYRIANRYVEPPYGVDVYFVDPAAAQNLDSLFARSIQPLFGPGFEVRRVNAHDDTQVILYRMFVWGTLLIHASVDRASVPAVVTSGGHTSNSVTLAIE